jgi:hypothetical protein
MNLLLSRMTFFLGGKGAEYNVFKKTVPIIFTRFTGKALSRKKGIRFSLGTSRIGYTHHFRDNAIVEQIIELTSDPKFRRKIEKRNL